MVNLEKSRWIVVDDSLDDQETLSLAIEDLGGSADCARTLATAEGRFRNQVYDFCILDSFLGRQGRGEDLIPLIRQQLPALPIIVMSSTTTPHLPGQAILSGADMFLPKLQNFEALKSMLRAAAVQATTLRRLRLEQYAPGGKADGRLFLTHDVQKQVENSIQRPYEMLLLNGATGTGKSSLARYVAARHLEVCYGQSARNILSFDCLSHSDAETALALFGESVGESEGLRLSLFERALGGVIILENIEALALENQTRLMRQLSLLTERRLAGFAVPAKMIFTCGNHAGKGLIPGFLESLAQREVDLPALAQLGGESRTAVLHVLGNVIEPVGDMVPLDSVVETVAGLVSRFAFPANFLSLEQLLRMALERAIADRRRRIFPTDIVVPQSWLENSTSEESDRNEFSPLLETPEGRELLGLVTSGEQYEEAKRLLRVVMIQRAAKICGNNKTRMSRCLGIARQSLYAMESSHVTRS